MFEVSEAVVQRSSRPEVLCTKDVFNFTGKQEQPAILLKKRLWHRYFAVDLAKFFRTLFFFHRTSPVAISEVYFSSRQRNIVCEYELHETNHEVKTNIFSCFLY